MSFATVETTTTRTTTTSSRADADAAVATTPGTTIMRAPDRLKAALTRHWVVTLFSVALIVLAHFVVHT